MEYLKLKSRLPKFLCSNVLIPFSIGFGRPFFSGKQDLHSIVISKFFVTIQHSAEGEEQRVKTELFSSN